MKKLLIGILLLVFTSLANASTLNCDSVSCTSSNGGGSIIDIGASVYLSANQSTSSGVWTTVGLNTEIFDTGSNFNTGTFTYTFSTAGKYRISASVQFASNGTGVRRGRLNKNSGTIIKIDYTDSGSEDISDVTFSHDDTFAVNDTLVLQSFQDTGTLNVLGTVGASTLAIRYIGK